MSQRSYLWELQVCRGLRDLNFTIRNNGGGKIFDLRLGIFSELASGYKGSYNVWPPSGWFHKKALEYFPAQRMMGEHHYTYQDGTAPSWGGIAILGTRGAGFPPIEEVPVFFNWWDYDAEIGNPGRFTDHHRFEILAARFQRSPQHRWSWGPTIRSN